MHEPWRGGGGDNAASRPRRSTAPLRGTFSVAAAGLTCEETDTDDMEAAAVLAWNVTVVVPASLGSTSPGWLPLSARVCARTGRRDEKKQQQQPDRQNKEEG